MEAPEELRGSLQQLSHLSSKFSARPENLLAEALREWAQRRGVLLGNPATALYSRAQCPARFRTATKCAGQRRLLYGSLSCRSA
mmetsp:Transcript_42337/g.108302  ORF Transcript_42337/g.108302 Transcript_42337/m.108302 type:complete len:84 (-) Transcript_42337:1186-1437(-)